MDNFWQIEIGINILLQNWGAWLTPIIHLFSFLGQEEFYILILPAIYWCLDGGLAIRLTLLLVASGYSNSLLKITIHGARPYWFDSRVKAIATESSFGMPSGHAQNAAAIWGFLSTTTANKWFKSFLFALIFFIGLSRLYLGVHFTSDVIVGWLLGGFTLLLFIGFEKPFLLWFNSHGFFWRTIFVSVISFMMIALATAWLAVQSRIPVPQNWVNLANNVPGANPLAPYSPSDMVTFASVFWGMMIGYLWLTERMEYDPAKGSLRQKLGRFFMGLLGILLIVFGVSAIFPSGTDLVSQIIRFIKYALAGVWISALAPVLFKKSSLI